MIYTSSTIALAVLEWRAHLTQWPPPPVMIIEIEFDAGLIWEPPKLPANWKQLPAPKRNSVIGDNWVAAGRSAVLKIPSAIVPNEFNYLLNPGHPRFGLIRRGRPQLFKVDARLGPLAVSKR
jgi:RES domain-containing protein